MEPATGRSRQLTTGWNRQRAESTFERNRRWNGTTTSWHQDRQWDRRRNHAGGDQTDQMGDDRDERMIGSYGKLK